MRGTIRLLQRVGMTCAIMAGVVGVSGGSATYAASTNSVVYTPSLSAEHVLSVRGEVRPVSRGERAGLQLGATKTSRRGWKTIGSAAAVSRNGSFVITAKAPSGASTLTVRVLVTRHGRIVARGSARRVSIPAGATLGAKAARPPTPSTPSSVATPISSSTPASVDSEAPPPGTPPGPPAPKTPASVLGSGETLAPGAYLLSPNHQYELAMQSDGNLVLYHEGKALWWSGTSGAGSYLAMQADGNLVVYYGSSASWNSGTWGFGGAYLQLQDDGNVVVYQGSHAVWDWESGYLGQVLNDGWTLASGDDLLSPNHQYELAMQPDGNLVLYHEGKALWWSGTSGAGSYLAMQADGNLVVYYGSSASWSTSTWGFAGAYLQVQDDGNVVVYQQGHPVWDWGSGYIGNQLNQWTLGPGAYLLSASHEYQLVMQATDGNLVLYQGGHALWSSGPQGAGASVTMQSDGNLVIYNGGSARWWSGTSGYFGAYFVLQNDGNAVIYQGERAIWDWESGLLTSEGTAAENGAIAWAEPYAERQDASFNGLCLSFVFDAYGAAGVNLRSWVTVPIGGNTYPSDIWGHFSHGTTGGGTPPYGALVFWEPTNHNRLDSHVALSLGGGNLVSTSDVAAPYTHFETMAAHSYAIYLGWWLPDR